MNITLKELINITKENNVRFRMESGYYDCAELWIHYNGAAIKVENVENLDAERLNLNIKTIIELSKKEKLERYNDLKKELGLE